MNVDGQRDNDGACQPAVTEHGAMTEQENDGSVRREGMGATTTEG